MGEPLISINFPLYGKFSRKRLRLAIDSIKYQEYSNFEIIVSEHNKTPSFRDESQKLGVSYFFLPVSDENGKVHFSLGKMRNNGIINSKGDIIYINDGDIIFYQENYLTRIAKKVQHTPNSFFIEPKMRRLPIVDFEKFRSKVQQSNLSSVISEFFFPDQYIVSMNKNNSTTIVRRKSTGKVYTTSESLFKLYNEGLSKGIYKEFDPRIWSTTIHHGTLVAKKEYFELIGGYHDLYLDWGYEDVDIQWKFAQKFIEIPLFEDGLEVIHLDHSKDYFSIERGKQNKQLFLARKKQGIENIIESDVSDYLKIPNS